MTDDIRIGMTLSSEEHGPDRLVKLARAAEAAEFDFVSISDHYHPWISAQGHAPFVWSVLGAISQTTSEIDVVVGVTCPTVRVHPAVVAQAVATTGVLLGDRFRWGVGSGENLNEHVIGAGWPPAPVRLEMLEEAIHVIRRLWSETSVTHRGRHYVVEDARILDRPEKQVPIIVSAFGPNAADLAARTGDGLWITGTDRETVEAFRHAGGDGPVYSQLTLCWASTKEEGVDTAHRQWPNTGLPGQLAQDLRTMLHFEQATQLVTPSIVERSIPCGPDPGPILGGIEAAINAGVDHVYLHQVGDDQEGFLDFWEAELRPELRQSRSG